MSFHQDNTLKISNISAKTTALLFLSTIIFIASCKKEMPQPVDPNAPPADIIVLRDGTSFSQDITLMVQTLNGYPLGIHDFAIDNTTNQLNFVYYSGTATIQMGVNRCIYDLATKKPVALPNPDWMLENTSLQDWTTTLEYFPYTGRLAGFTTTGYQYGNYSRAFWGGYILMTEMPWFASVYGGYTGGFGYRNVYSDVGKTKHFMTISPEHTASVRLGWGNYEYKSPSQTEQNLASFPEPRFFGAYSSVIVTVDKDSVIAYKVKFADTAAGTPAEYTKTGQLTPAGYSTGITYTTQRHYSTDGSKLAMMVRDDVNKKYWTYTYNHTSQTLAAVISAADLPYSGEGSDIDMDEEGNIYYTGTSGNGAGAGVSIYKRTSSGTTLVGTDDFLKFGTVVKLRYINGKVHLAVSGSVTGSTIWKQVCFISQQ